MKKRTLCLSFCTLLMSFALVVVPVHAEESKATSTEKSESSSGKHNFDTWQTIKRLQAVSNPR